MRRLLTFLFHLIQILLVFASLSPAAAQSAGYDLLQTRPNTSIDLRSIGLGEVTFQGFPIQSTTGSADTIIRRTGSATYVSALSLKSTQPVIFQKQAADVYVTINNSGGVISTSILPQPDSLPASMGNLTVRTDGSFDCDITLNADLIFVKAGSSFTNSGNYLGHQPAPSITLKSTNSPWSNKPPRGYPLVSVFPAGDFYPLKIEASGRVLVPASCVASYTGRETPAPATKSTSGPPTSRDCIGAP
jgi:hypothetical protein